MTRHIGIGHHLRVALEVIGTEAAKQEPSGGELRSVKEGSELTIDSRLKRGNAENLKY
jgi:Flp pilus assembly protein TadB